MKLFRRILGRNRVLSARRRLAKEPSPRHYAELAQEYAILGLTREVQDTCEEGLGVFPGHAELLRLRDRARRFEREERMVTLKRELAEAPRPALWSEMCDIQLESGRLARAEEYAQEWLARTGEPEAKLALARIMMNRFFADRGRELGERAHEALEQAAAALPGDARPQRSLLSFTTRIGAWSEARKACAQLLQLAPGDPLLEGRYRALDAHGEEGPSVSHALIAVERTGRFADEPELEVEQGQGGDVRPVLRELAAESDVQAALYVRGSTVLVQGPRGATAERTARSVHTILTTSRTAGRRLGLGQVFQVQLEGDFGTLAIAASESDAGALWCNGLLSRGRERSLTDLVGLNAATEEVPA